MLLNAGLNIRLFLQESMWIRDNIPILNLYFENVINSVGV